MKKKLKDLGDFILKKIIFRTHGFDCCYGFSLNKMTGKCEGKYM